MDAYDLRACGARPGQPAVLASHPEARAVVVELDAGELLEDHQVHERAWVVVIDGEAELSAGSAARRAGPGTLAVFAPRERHEVRALTATRLLLLLAPWPGDGHPGSPG